MPNCPRGTGNTYGASWNCGSEATQGFWEQLVERPQTKRKLPRDAKRSLEESLPDHNLEYWVVQREAGLGSLGQQRFVAIARCHGGYIAREAKRMVPSASVWLDGRIGCHQSFYQSAIGHAVRSRDPYQFVRGAWLVRRLSPDSNPIKVEELSGKRDEERLLHAMSSEAANVHLGQRRRAKFILKDLGRRKPDWLRAAAKKMTQASMREWKRYRN
jgi:hypothetical protein